jgi:hypothetical protein
VVDEHAGEIVADGFVDQGCDHRRVDAAGETEDDFAVTDLIADISDSLFDEFIHSPTAGASALFGAEFDSLLCAEFFACEIEGGELEGSKLFFCFGAFRCSGIGTDDEADGTFLTDTLDRDSIGHHHSVDVLVTDGAGELLDVGASEIQQDYGFRSLFHKKILTPN